MTVTGSEISAHRLGFLQEVIDQLKENHLYQELKTMASPQGVRIVVNGKSVLNFSSNNYLGLTTHPKLVKAAHEAIDSHGVGTASVRTIIGTMDLH